MIHISKQCGIRAAFSPSSGAILLLDARMYDLLQELHPPLPQELPMDVRYFFAKYDSADLQKAYAAVRSFTIEDAEKTPLPNVLTAVHATSSSLRKRQAELFSLWKVTATAPFSLTLTWTETDTDTLPAMLRTLRDTKMFSSLHLRIPVSLRSSQEWRGELDEIVWLGDAIEKLQAPFTAFTATETIRCTFDSATDLPTQVERLYALGYRRISAVPSESMPSEDAIRQYEKLARALFRQYRSSSANDNGSLPFLPFTFGARQNGFWMREDAPVHTARDSMPGILLDNGTLSHLSEDIQDPAILTVCAECAAALSTVTGASLPTEYRKSDATER